MTRPPDLVVEALGRPYTANASNRLHYRQRAKLRAEWRDTTTVLARQAKLPRHDRPVVFTAQARYQSGHLTDCDAIAPTAKACLDGLVHAGVLVDDKAPFVAEVRYIAPVLDRSVPHALLLWIDPA